MEPFTEILILSTLLSLLCEKEKIDTVDMLLAIALGIRIGTLGIEMILVSFK